MAPFVLPKSATAAQPIACYVLPNPWPRCEIFEVHLHFILCYLHLPIMRYQLWHQHLIKKEIAHVIGTRAIGSNGFG